MFFLINSHQNYGFSLLRLLKVEKKIEEKDSQLNQMFPNPVASKPEW